MMEDKQPAPGRDQAAVLSFLSHHEPRCKRIDTHASIVFLGRDRVLKVKRAIRLPFLDYSTLEKRKHACEEELIVNRHFAPEIYRRTVPITQDSAGFQIGGRGPVVEWAVEMSRFDDDKTFDHLAATGDIAPHLAEMLAVVLHDAHQRAGTAGGSSWLSSIAGIIERNTRAFRSEAALSREAIERLDALSQQKHRQCRDLLEERASRGQVRRCHGDAHLGNIVLIDGKPVLFDAIEFDPVIATTDILYDLAFPVMDFWRFGLTACANRLFNAYLRASWPENGTALRLLPLFLSMRAAIRSNVLFAKRHLSPEHDDGGRAARTYFELALRCIEPAPPSLIAIGGKSGTGKSVLAAEIAALSQPEPGAVLLRSDVIRKEMFGIDPLAPLPSAAYTQDVTARVYQTLTERSRQILDQGISVVVDAAFLKASERDDLLKAATRARADFRPAFLTADLATRLERVGKRRNDASDATTEIVALQEEYEMGDISWPIIDASGSPGQTLERSKPVLVDA